MFASQFNLQKSSNEVSKIILIMFNYVKILNNHQPPFYILTFMQARNALIIRHTQILNQSFDIFLDPTFSVTSMTFVALWKGCFCQLACLPLSQLIFIHARQSAILRREKQKMRRCITQNNIGEQVIGWVEVSMVTASHDLNNPNCKSVSNS